MALPGGRSESMVEAVDRVFDEMDDDGSGSLDIDEFGKAMRDYGVGLSPGEIKTILEAFDTD